MVKNYFYIQICYIYCMIYELGIGLCGFGCLEKDIGKGMIFRQFFNEIYWMCLKGCLNNVIGSDFNYIVIVLGESLSWEQGENRFE